MKPRIKDLSGDNWVTHKTMAITVAAVDVEGNGRAVALMLDDGRLFPMRSRAEVEQLVKLIHESEAIAWPRGSS
jgi:hypothetical protein